MLGAIVIMLTALSSDWRVKLEQRQRAQKLLDDMTPARIVTAGLFADYTAECSSFFREFEGTDHDLALASAHKQTFIKRVKTLFPMALSSPTCLRTGARATSLHVRRKPAQPSSSSKRRPSAHWSTKTEASLCGPQARGRQ